MNTLTLNLRDTAIGAGLMLIMVLTAATSYSVTSGLSDERQRNAIAAIDFSGCAKDTKTAVWVKKISGEYKGEVYLRCLK